MRLDELERLHEHTARTAARVVHPAAIRLDHRDQQADHAARGVELAAALALGAGELGQEILIHAAEGVLGLVLFGAQADIRDGVDELAQGILVQAGQRVDLGQCALERRIVALDGVHGVVQAFADIGELGLGL